MHSKFKRRTTGRQRRRGSLLHTMCLLLLGVCTRSDAFATKQHVLTNLRYGYTHQYQQPSTFPITLAMVRIWIEDAEEGFVDSDENLEEGEICIRSIKAFASNPDDPMKNRFLCAGALVQRPEPSVGLQLYDAWIADSILVEGGPNLQKLGALQVIDALFLEHLKQFPGEQIRALRSFVVQCDISSDSTCASYQAMLDRGFQPFQTVLTSCKRTFYNLEEYGVECLAGNIFAHREGVERYQEVAADEEPNISSVAAEIVQLLPDQALVERSMLDGAEASRNHEIIQYLFGDVLGE